MEIDGLVTVGVEFVRDCASNYLELWEINRKNAKEAAISKQRNRRILPAKTRESALLRLKCPYTGYAWDNKAGFWRDKAKALLASADASCKDTMLLDVGIVNWLSDYSTPPKPEEEK